MRVDVTSQLPGQLKTEREVRYLVERYSEGWWVYDNGTNPRRVYRVPERGHPQFRGRPVTNLALVAKLREACACRCDA